MSSTSVDIIESYPDSYPWARAVLHAIPSLRYGSVEVVIHDGRVVQIERREKVRFDDAGHHPPDHRGRETTSERRADRTTGSPEAAKAEETNR